jgi:hypothetical protein
VRAALFQRLLGHCVEADSTRKCRMRICAAVEMRLLRIPKGCRKVARGKRSAAPGMFGEEGLHPERARDVLRLTNVLCLASFQGAVRLCSRVPGLRFACPWLPSSISCGMAGGGSFAQRLDEKLLYTYFC